MKNFTALLFIILFALSICAQKPRRKTTARPAKTGNATSVASDEKTEFDAAVAAGNAAAKIAALRKFVADFPDSAEKNSALEMIVAARAEAADEKMRAGQTTDGIALFKLAVEDAPAQMSDKLFADVILQIPTNLYFRGERTAAIEMARAIEAKAEGSAKQTLALATFYLGTENGDEAKRLAEKALSLDPNLPAAYQTLGLANRLNFDLEDAASAYQKALELDADSAVSKRSLAEMKRALGKSDEAAALYREILDKNPSDALAASGLTLALFDAGKQTEAEDEMQKALEQNPNNLTVLVGAAYAYAARGDVDRAVELARKAVSVEPRYVWGYIALARGYLRQNRFYDAESALLAARAYGNFPTLDYELATVRAAAGYYREAAQTLAKSFVIKDDFVNVRLGGRVERQAKSFIELIAPERRASIFEPLAADDAQNAERLKSLLDFYQKAESADHASSAEIADAAGKFIAGDGDQKMRLHRRLFTADYLLKKNVGGREILELIKPASAEVEAALDVPNASAAVLADELYTSRAAAIARNQLVVVPEVQRQTLSSVLRGRIEEITGAALLAENKPSEAAVRFKRGLSVLPDKSAWWRSTEWRLGAALEADGKPADALSAYIKSYMSGSDAATAERRAVIESLYLKINGTLDGLDAKIGAKSATDETAAMAQIQNSPAQNQTAPANVTDAPQAQTPVVEAPKTSQIAAETKPLPENPVPPIAKVSNENAPTVVQTPVEAGSEPAKTESEKQAKPDEQKPSAPKNTVTEPANIQTDAKPIAAPTTAKQIESAVNQPKKESEETSAKPLFEPIIISVPKVESPVKAKSEDKSNATAEESADKSTGDSKETKRPRIFSESGVAEKEPSAAKCELTFSQDSVSLVNGGGSLGVLIGLDSGDAKEIHAVSSSPLDVEIALEPEIGASTPNRAYFIFKSVSSKPGVYTVTFEAPCGGKKEFVVKVR